MRPGARPRRRSARPGSRGSRAATGRRRRERPRALPTRARARGCGHPPGPGCARCAPPSPRRHAAAARSAVSSEDASSATMSSQSPYVCAATDASVSSIHAAESCAGTITLTRGTAEHRTAARPLACIAAATSYGSSRDAGRHRPSSLTRRMATPFRASAPAAASADHVARAPVEPPCGRACGGASASRCCCSSRGGRRGVRVDDRPPAARGPDEIGHFAYTQRIVETGSIPWHPGGTPAHAGSPTSTEAGAAARDADVFAQSGNLAARPPGSKVAERIWRRDRAALRTAAAATAGSRRRWATRRSTTSTRRSPIVVDLPAGLLRSHLRHAAGEHPVAAARSWPSRGASRACC